MIQTKWISRSKKYVVPENWEEMKNVMMKLLDISEMTTRLLLNRGIKSVDDAQKYLKPNLEDLHDPFLFSDMEKIIKRILEAKLKKEIICIYGDYDADGTIGVSVLYAFMKNQGFNVEYYIPNRLKTGYGLHKEPLKALIEQGVNLLITVDNGISANEEIDYCNQNNVDVIITDHHECHGNIPDAFGILNPKHPQSSYPFKELCGAGVAFKLVQGLAKELNIDLDFHPYIELVALATVADLVPLVNENRTLVYLGLMYLNKAPKNLGIKGLIEVSKLDTIKAWHFGFVLGPKINAAGRLGEANRIVELLTSKNSKEILELALFLNDENQKRQELEKEILKDALETVKKNELYKKKIVIVAGKNWHSGVIGIVASRLQEDYYGPVIVIGIENGIGKGSCRSVDGLNIFEALKSCEDLFISYGGHQLAAGFSIKEEKIVELSYRLNLYAETISVETVWIKPLYYDMKINEDDINWKILEEIEQFEPCGIGNPGIQLMLDHSQISYINTMGKEKNHLNITFKKMRGVGFGLANYLSDMLSYSGEPKEEFAFLGRLDKNEYRGQKTLQLIIKDIKLNPIWDIDKAKEIVKILVIENNPSECVIKKLNGIDPCEMMITREEIVWYYQIIKKYNQKSFAYGKLLEENMQLNPFHLFLSFEILREAGLIAYKVKKDLIYAKIIQSDKKKDIQKTQLMIKLKETYNQ